MLLSELSELGICSNHADERPAWSLQPHSPVPRDKPGKTKGKAALHHVLWSLGPRAHPEHRSPCTQRWAGAEPSALAHTFSSGSRGIAGSCLLPHVPETEWTLMAPKKSHSDAGSLLTEQHGWHSSADPAITWPPKEHKAGKTSSHRHTQSSQPKRRGCLDFLCPISQVISSQPRAVCSRKIMPRF